MARYIDADLLMKEFCDFVRPSNNSDFAPVPTWNDAVSLVGSAPTADVVERKNGSMTNADRIRSMTDEELAVWIVHKTEGNGFDGYEESVKAWLDWLKEGVGDGKIH